jgi:uncharacterized membrane protein YccF (DUF307 family)
MRTLGNFLWIIAGGFFTSLAWVIIGCIAFISIIGIPWGRACFVMAKLSLAPFGKTVMSRKDLNQKEDVGTGALGTLGNIVWLVTGGWIMALSHALYGAFCCVTIIGIPFGIQHFKLGGLALMPIGKTVVPVEVALAATKMNAEAHVANLRAGS